jgi:hypothetical protein
LLSHLQSSIEKKLFLILKKNAQKFSESDYVRDFLRQWRLLDRLKYPGAADSNGISASGALAYDGVYVMEAAFKALLQQKPNIFRHNVRRGELVKSHAKKFPKSCNFD